jgi:hypothetical protein
VHKTTKSKGETSMPIKSIFFFILCLALQGNSAPSASGFAVAAHWSGAYDFQWGYDWRWSAPAQILRYDITNGAVTKTTALYTGYAHRATLNPDGKRMAFVHPFDTSYHGFENKRYKAYIAVMNPGGGPVTDVVAVPSGFWGFQMTWPTGDWIYYFTADSASGRDQFWKVNANTKQVVKLGKLKDSLDWVWQFEVANDGDKAIIRVGDGSPSYANSDCLHFQFSKNVNLPDSTINLMDPVCKAFSGYFDAGCGVGVSPDGRYQMRYSSISHDQVSLETWEQTNAGFFTYSDAANWTGGGGFIGKGGNNPQWSCNDPKWICSSIGINAREATAGCNQVLINWVDHQIIHTSTDPATDSTHPRMNTETGDFWVSPASTIVQRPATLATVPVKNSTITVYNMLGRSVYQGAAMQGASLKRGIYLVQRRAGKSVQTKKLAID